MLRHCSLFRFSHGDHSCVFYRSDDYLLEVLTPYVADGLRRGERCFCVEKPHIGTRLLSDLRLLGFDTDDLLLRGALEIRREDEVYIADGKFNPYAMMDMLMRSLNETLERGFPAFRIAGDASWAVDNPAICSRLLDYEGLVNAYFPGRAAIGLCQYDANAFSPRLLESVVNTHDLHILDLPASPSYSGISIRSGNFWSDIVVDKRASSPTYHYVVRVQRRDEIVGWGAASNYDHAHAAAKQVIRRAES
jgi:MEDS: MEthanogen/methylotroph, DcmR Sensory domain